MSPYGGNSGLDKILGRIEDLDTVNLNILVQRLARERKMQETVFNTIQDGILVIDTEGVVQYANDAGRRIVGLKNADVGVARLWKMMPDLAAVADMRGADPGEKHTPVVSREVELNYPEHRFVRLYMVAIGAQVGHSDSGGFVVVLTDVTEEKVSMEERIESERIASIMRLAAGVAHELGNPLNSLTIHLQLIERKLQKMKNAENAKLLESVQVCQGEVGRLDGIITHFLEAIRPKEPEMNELDLIELVEEVLRVQEAELKDRRLDVNVEVAESVPVVFGDRGQIKQVFFNLVKNAMEAMEAGGRLRIVANTDDDFVYLQFIDTGSGISEEDLSRVFQAYYTTKKEGHGLGMMIVQRIMRDHGGQIGIESQAGKGTVVTLKFPQKHRRTRLLESGRESGEAGEAGEAGNGGTS